MKTTFHFLLLLLLCHTGQAQIITTVAGSGDTTLGDGGPALHASLYGPFGVALDGHGNMYVTDGYHNRIRKIDATGNISTIAGTGVQGYNGDDIPAAAAQIYRPCGIIFDANGNLIFCDAYNNRVRKIDAAGIITTIAGNSTTVYNGDNIAATAASIYTPHCVALDVGGNLYITDNGNHRVRKVSAAGVITTIAGTGVMGYSGDDSLATGAMINFPYGIAVDTGGNIYFADTYENVIRKIDGSGIITTFAGTGAILPLGDGGPATAAALNNPMGIVIDGTNAMFITVANEERIRKVVAGVITTVAGVGTLGFSGDNGPATAAELAQPVGICIDHTLGVIYFADFANSRVRRIGWPVGVSDLTQGRASLNIYPNPSNGTFTCAISSATNELFTISITDLLGRIVKEFAIEPGTLQQLELAQPGVYLLTARNKTNAVAKTVVITK
ncbi:hypothetical protein CJD36_009995 [Flavipsychrobacter stenotrophus]|uniref:Uncharacterized protein n=1 Tax=Flavipsychrobacter stenotrophus TaxID=2077091 RepID=A0A2S7SZJ1_9BACT|nr:T9SS type A sorting domain-containing protein [Flavipsychrobacter stenotrophus]PQJ12108.1 hypothetical protein CJD36_009995 [Flavipsychrobacter stenotrophus]